MKKEKKKLSTVVNVLLIFQAMLTISLLLLLFISIGEEAFMGIANVLVIILFLTMGLNNHVLYKRKGFTIFNIIMALFLLVRLFFFR